jgi:hypothetical protein
LKHDEKAQTIPCGEATWRGTKTEGVPGCFHVPAVLAPRISEHDHM